jgi:Arc/MetJ family transcription regulator
VTTPDFTDPRAHGAKFEKLLTEEGIKAYYDPEFPIEMIRNRAGTQVRIGEDIVDSERVRDFQTMKRGGATYPPIVASAAPDPDIVWLVDGNHRVAADRGLHRQTIPVYVTQQLTDGQAYFLAAALNRLEGQTLTSEQVEHAAMEAFALGYSDDDIARRLGRNRGRINQLRNERQFVERLAKCNTLTLAGVKYKPDAAIEMLTNPKRIPKRQQRKLNQIHNDPAFLAATVLTYEVRTDYETVAELVDSINGARTEADAVNEVAKKRIDLDPIGSGDPKVPNRLSGPPWGSTGEVYNGVKKLARYKDHESTTLFNPNHPDADERRTNFAAAYKVLGGILDSWETE